MAILKWKFSNSSSHATAPVHPPAARATDEHVNGHLAAPAHKANVERQHHLDSNPNNGVTNHTPAAPKLVRKNTPEVDAGIGVNNKMFGMENFGNTCYCNSILQCLFYTSELREAVLEFPPTPPRARKKSVPGLRPHPALAVAASEAAAALPANSNGLEADNPSTKLDNAHGTDHSSTSSLDTEHTKKNRLSFISSSLGGRHTLSNNTGPTLSNNTASNGTHPIDNNSSTAAAGGSQVTAAAVVSNPPNGQNITPENDPNSYEQKKRAALLKGPIINMDLSYASDYGMEESLFTSLKDIFESINESSSATGVVSPSKLIEVLKRDNELFRSSMHQDAHEFLNFLLNEVIDRVRTHAQKLGSESGTEVSASIARLGDLFEGDLSSETKCLTCERVSTRDEKFLDLSIDLENDTSVTACLRQFSAIEMLCERNKFYCDVCNGLQEAEKRMKIKRLPRILALHLKRFKFTEDMQRNVKLFHKVVYPFHLRLFDTTDDANDPNRLYELYAVVVHIGGGPYHGHYVAIVKNSENSWILYDDELVEQVDENFVKNFFGDRPGMASAYVLFYRCITDAELDEERRYVNPDFLKQHVKSATDETARETGAVLENPVANDERTHHPSTVPEAEITQDMSSSSDEVMTASSVLDEGRSETTHVQVSEDFYTFTTPNQMPANQSTESNVGDTQHKAKVHADHESSHGKAPSSDGLNSVDENGSHMLHSAEDSQDHLSVPGSSPSDHIPDIQHHHSKKMSLGHGLSRLRSTSRSKKEKEGSRFWKKDKDKKDSTESKDSDSYGHHQHHGGLKNGFGFGKNKKSNSSTIHEGESVF